MSTDGFLVDPLDSIEWWQEDAVSCASPQENLLPESAVISRQNEKSS